MALGSTLVFTSLLIYASLGRELQVSFELEDSDVNEVIFVNETNIVLRCRVTGVSSEYTIRIERTNTDDVVALARNENCLEFVIKDVSKNDGGEYTCNVSYIDINGARETKADTLHLNVQDGLTPQCFRNGTSGQPYFDSDLLLVTCYCREVDTPCRWISGVPGSGTSNFVTPFETKSRSDKMILRLLVNVGSSTLFASTTRYDCFNGGTASQRCKIGPQNESSTDVVINSHAVDTFADPLDCELLSTSTVTSQKQEFTTSLNIIRNISRTVESNPILTSEPGTSNTGVDFVVIGISVVIGVAFVLIIILIIVFILLKCRKDGNNDKAAKGKHHMYTNDAYTIDSIDQHTNKNVNKNVSNDLGNDSRRDNLHIDHMKGNNDPDLGDLYAKIDKSRRKSGDEMLEMESTPAHHNASVVDKDSGELYAKVDKNRKKETENETLGMEPALERHNASAGEKDLGSLYATVDKDRHNLWSEADEGKPLEYGDESNMYAETDKK